MVRNPLSKTETFWEATNKEGLMCPFQNAFIDARHLNWNAQNAKQGSESDHCITVTYQLLQDNKITTVFFLLSTISQS